MTMEREGFYFIDTADYDKAATKLIEEGTFGLEYERPPVYPLFLAAVYSISFQSLLLVRIVQCFLGSLICLLIFLIGEKVYGIKTRLIGGLICAV
jgi:4-amino-4-deoxy-L-arabinose transferase-like glycosyltransferase